MQNLLGALRLILLTYQPILCYLKRGFQNDIERLRLRDCDAGSATNVDMAAAPDSEMDLVLINSTTSSLTDEILFNETGNNIATVIYLKFIDDVNNLCQISCMTMSRP